MKQLSMMETAAILREQAIAATDESISAISAYVDKNPESEDHWHGTIVELEEMLEAVTSKCLLRLNSILKHGWFGINYNFGIGRDVTCRDQFGNEEKSFETPDEIRFFNLAALLYLEAKTMADTCLDNFERKTK